MSRTLQAVLLWGALLIFVIAMSKIIDYTGSADYKDDPHPANTDY